MNVAAMTWVESEKLDNLRIAVFLMKYEALQLQYWCFPSLQFRYLAVYQIVSQIDALPGQRIKPGQAFLQDLIIKESVILTVREKEVLSTQTTNHTLRLCLLCVPAFQLFGLWVWGINKTETWTFPGWASRCCSVLYSCAWTQKLPLPDCALPLTRWGFLA